MNVFVTKVFEGSYADLDTFKALLRQRISHQKENLPITGTHECTNATVVNGDVVCNLGFVDMNPENNLRYILQKAELGGRHL